jgi:hypothetical protein
MLEIQTNELKKKKIQTDVAMVFKLKKKKAIISPLSDTHSLPRQFNSFSWLICLAL